MSTTALRLPDLNAPRYRLPVAGMLNKATYQAVREQVPAVAGFSDAQLKELLLQITQQFWQQAIQNRDGVELPEMLGHLFLASCPGRKGDSVDYKNSARLGEKVKHRNWESDGFLAKIFYSNVGTRYQFKHHELWGFQACKKFKQAVGQQYPRQWQMYVRIEPDRKTKSLFFNRQHKLDQQKKDQLKLEHYNELDF